MPGALSEGAVNHVTPAFRTYSGPSAIDRLRRELDKTSSVRAVVIGSPSVFGHEQAIGRLREHLGDRLVGEFDGVEEHSPIPAVERARDFIAESGATVVVSVGGGSAVVTARAAVILAAEHGKDVRELCTTRGADGRLVSPRLAAPKLPIWCVPTTPTTACAKAGTAVRDPETGERLALFDPKTRAQGIVLDPAMALTAPATLVRSASLSALALAVEGLLSGGGDPLAEALLSHAVRLELTWLDRLAHGARQGEPVGLEPRLQLMFASLLSGQGSDFTPGGLAQGLSHTIGPRSTVANGVVEAMLLPAAVRRHASLGGTEVPVLSDATGAGSGSTEPIADRLEAFLVGLGEPRRLRDIGVTEDSLDGLASHAMEDWAVASMAHPPTADELRQLLRSLF